MVTFIPRQETFPIFQGDDEDRLFAIEREIAALESKAEREAKAVRTMLDTTDTQGDIDRLKDEHDTLYAEAEPRAIKVTMVAVGRKKWKALVDAHPPKPGDEAAEKAGLDEDAFAEDAVRRCLLEPKFPSEDERDEWLDKLSDAQFNLLYATAVGLNRTVGASPKAMRSSGLFLSDAGT